MQVKEVMSTDVHITRADHSICEAARMMAAIDAGALPVSDEDRLVGMITDRDIAVRAVAAHKSPDTPVREVMSAEVMYCFDDDDLDAVAQNMADIKVRRLPVVNRDKRLVGIVSLADIALVETPRPSRATPCQGFPNPAASIPSRSTGRVWGNGRRRIDTAAAAAVPRAPRPQLFTPPFLRLLQRRAGKDLRRCGACV